MKVINTIIRSIFLPSLGGLVWVFFFASCTCKTGSLADVAEDDSLYIDTVATLDEVIAPDTIALPDSLMKDSL